MNDFVPDKTRSPLHNLFDFNTSLKKKVLTYPANQRPPEIDSLVSSESFLKPKQSVQLSNFIQARDTLVTWNIIGRSIGAEEDMSDAFESCDAAIEKASGFSDWIEQNQAQLTNLQMLNLSENQLTSVPAQIGQLTNLQMLNLSNNRITSLPPEMGQLINLQKLY